MTTKTLTQSDLQHLIGERVEVSIRLGNTYECEVIDVTEQTLTVSHYDFVKDRLKETDIDLNHIEWVEIV
jgi:hypothetical protein